MSHLNHILALNTKLVEDDITTCPIHHAKIVDSAVTRAIIAYAYITGGIEGPALTEPTREAMHKAVEAWNEVSPLNYRKIFDDVTIILQRLYNQAAFGGNFQPIKVDIEDLDIDLLDIPEFKTLFHALLTEIIECNK